jgi:small subunit ribosomal protein S4
MARQTGAKHKLCRRLGECIWGKPNCPSAKRPFPPGQHGQNQRKKKSVYGMQLLQKQKVRVHYGLMERQLQNTFATAKRMGGVTDANFMMLLESRLDAVTYRFGFANSMSAARQLVSHGHMVVDGQPVDRPSFRVTPGMTVGVAEKSRKIPMIANGVELPGNRIPEYLDRAQGAFEGKMTSLPNLETIPFQADTQAIIGFYSR